MPDTSKPCNPACDPGPPARRQKFSDPETTANGDPRAFVALTKLTSLWFNTGSLCNIACAGCYIESSPTNGRLAYLTAADVRSFLDEVARDNLPVEEIGFTGGEPFLNRDIIAMLADALDCGFRVTVLTNAMKPMLHRRLPLQTLHRAHASLLTLRVSIDHYRPELHERVRGRGTWEPMLANLRWLVDNGFRFCLAGRTCWPEGDDELRAGYARLFAAERIPLDAADPGDLVLFPEMDAHADVPEISVRCWDILGVAPADMMCASSRMVIRRRGARSPVVVSCTLLPYDPQFELGSSLAAAAGPVTLNHRFCAQFCVLGGASCSAPAR
jgi:uncharacterized Fe-S cluster-containing radical SAM superfamily protein